MSQKIIKIGSSLGVTIPKSIAQKLKLQAGDRIDLKVDAENRVIMYEPIKEDGDDKEEREKVSKLTQSFIKRYKKDLDALAQK